LFSVYPLIHFNGRALPCEIVDHGQSPQTEAIKQGVRAKIHGPVLVGPAGHAALHPVSGTDVAPGTFVAKMETFIAVEPKNSLVVYLPAFPSQKYMDMLVAVANPGRRYLLDPHAKRRLIIGLGLVAKKWAVHFGYPTGPPLAHLKGIQNMANQTPATDQALEFFCDDILQHGLVQAKIGHQPLKLAIFLLQLLQTSELARPHAALLLLPTGKGLFAYPHLAAYLHHPGTMFRLPDGKSNLRLRKMRLLHGKILHGSTDLDSAKSLPQKWN